jgi:GNAT superfamily N-acetyltransferase
MTDQTIQVREATADDVRALSLLMVVLGFPVSTETLTERLNRLQRTTGDRVLVADDARKRVVGFAVVHLTPSLHRPTYIGRITAMAVAPDVQGHGVGRALVQAAEHHLRESGCERMEVTSSQRHAAAHVFYRRCGFEDDGVRFAKGLL